MREAVLLAGALAELPGPELAALSEQWGERRDHFADCGRSKLAGLFVVLSQACTAELARRQRVLADLGAELGE